MDHTITDAFLVMILGMSCVLVFLLLLVAVMQLIIRLAPAASPVLRPGLAADPTTTDPALTAVLQAAVLAYQGDESPHRDGGV